MKLATESMNPEPSRGVLPTRALEPQDPAKDRNTLEFKFKGCEVTVTVSRTSS